MALSLALFLALAQTYPETMHEWRQAREANLKADNGWLTVAGLFWLQPGVNKAGAGDENPVRLPDGYPKFFGTFEKHGETVVFRYANRRRPTWEAGRDGFDGADPCGSGDGGGVEQVCG